MKNAKGGLRKKILISAWVLTPVVLLGLHYGPGQRAVAADRVASSVSLALKAEASENWSAAKEAWKTAISQVAEADKDERVRLTLKYQMARVMHGELPQALEDTAALLKDAQNWKVKDATERQVRTDLAAMHYWAAWLMRLEGAAAPEWEPVAEQARQHFRFLAETEGDKDSAQKKNLESTIRLIRMDLSELQGLPLPKECKNCKNCSGQCKAQREGRCNSMSDQKKDGRQEVLKQKTQSAGANNRSNAPGW